MALAAAPQPPPPHALAVCAVNKKPTARTGSRHTKKSINLYGLVSLSPRRDAFLDI
jgi:hypothetical protein